MLANGTSSLQQGQGTILLLFSSLLFRINSNKSFTGDPYCGAGAAAVLAAAGATFADIVKTTIFLKTMDDFAKVNAIYAERFPHDPPARATVEAAKLPRGALVEIDAIAVI